MPDEPVPTPPVPTPAPPKPAEPSTPSSDKGFPDDTALTEMNVEQREAYWKHQARKHEQTVKTRAAEYDELKSKAARSDALERELMSDKDKAVAQSVDDTRAAVRSEFAPRLVAAEFKAAAAGRIDGDRLAVILEPLDLSKFLNGDDVDTDKVAAFVNGISPVVDAAQQRRGPSTAGAGNRSSSTGPSQSAGNDAYARRHKKSA